jgi:hypothetical protein
MIVSDDGTEFTSKTLPGLTRGRAAWLLLSGSVDWP